MHRAQQEEAAVTAALARVGRELIARVDPASLLQRLCELTTAELHCDFSQIWLWQEEDKVFTAAASFGDPLEQWEWLRSTPVPREYFALLIGSSRGEGGIPRVAELKEAPIGRLVSAMGITSALALEMRRGGTATGLHIAGYRGCPSPFSRGQEHIARGIAQLGSLALESAELVERLEHANQLKSKFLATVSHELRTPIHIITGYHEMLLDGALGPLNPEQADILDRAAFSAVELSALITAILDVSRLEAGRVQVDLTEIELDRLIHEIDKEVQALVAEKAGLRFAWEIDTAPGTLTTDRMKLKIVLKNLISNGIKFTDSGEVVARIVERLKGIEFSVRDTGAGIAAAKRDEIFEAFRQGDSSATRRHGGVGLGLYIGKNFVELLGGRIYVDSTPGRGSTFFVWLPKNPVCSISDG
jgi:signal transduction histidine kinase